MADEHHGGDKNEPGGESSRLPGLLARLPVPVFMLRPLFSRLINTLLRRHPDLFDRLGQYEKSRFLLDPVDLPFVLLLHPDAENPLLEPHERGDNIEFDASISGPIDKFIELVNGEVDGDSLFFSRDLVIEGDTEAVLALRNAVDDMEINLVEEVEGMMGPLAPLAHFARKRAREAEMLAGDLKLVIAESLLNPTIDRSRPACSEGEDGDKS